MYRVRLATKADEHFLQVMLLQAASSPDVVRPALDEVLQDERLARYIADWGRPADGGVVAGADGQREAFGRPEPATGAPRA